jgi:Cu+-exporting ATPase
MSACCQNVADQAASLENAAAAGVEGNESSGFAWAKLAIAGMVSAQSMAFGMAINLNPPTGTARIVIHSILAVCAVAVFLLTGLPLLRTAVREAFRGRIVFEQLFLAGILGAFFASLSSTLSGQGSVYYEVVSILLAIYTLGTLLGERRRKAALLSAWKLDREFSTCTVLDPDGNTHIRKASEIRPGDLIQCRAGDGIAVDGIVEKGIGFVREAALTGEPFPVVKRPGDRVFAGSNVLDAALVIRAEGGTGRRLDQLLEAVRAAQESPGSLQREADRLTRWFLPLVMLASVLTFTGWTFAGKWHAGLFNALAVLLVACPCAMGLAVPIGIWSALAALARRGLAAKAGDFVERLATVDTVAFDKTGTLSEETLQVVDFVTAPGEDRSTLLQYAAAVQTHSAHPVAAAFHRWNPGCATADGIEVIPGTGVRSRIQSGSGAHSVEIGNDTLVKRHSVEAAALLDLLRPEAKDGLTKVWMLVDGRVAGLAVLRECLRNTARDTIRALEEMGCKVHVWTGDTAERASVHQLDNTAAGLSAEEKAALVRAEQAVGRRVLFVGDGINDAPAMGEAHASIALTGGAEIAAAASGARLYGAHLPAVAQSIRICRGVVRLMRQNLLFAAFYNLVAVTMAASGLLHPVAAALIMLVSSATVTWRALREAERIETESEPNMMKEENTRCASPQPLGAAVVQ